MSEQISTQKLSDTIEYLITSGFIICHRGKYKFTAKFYETLTGIAEGIVKDSSGKLIVHESGLPVAVTANWPEVYMHFILEAKVPARLEDNTGKPYYANKYSDEACKMFRHIIEAEGIDIRILVKSTMLYYKSSVAYKKAITNYIVQGDWRTDYMELKQQLISGDNLEEYINKEISVNNGSNYDWA